MNSVPAINRSELTELLPCIRNHYVLNVRNQLVFIAELTPHGYQSMIDGHVLEDAIEDVIHAFRHLLLKGIQVQIQEFRYDENRQSLAIELCETGVRWWSTQIRALSIMDVQYGMIPRQLFATL